MLSYQLLKNHAGLLLVGDYTTLRLLHEVVHEVNERSPLIKDEEGPFIGLAYDARKAYEQQREVLPPPEGFEERGTRYGVRILWPVLLVQQRMLRASLAYLDHSKWHQAITYALEAVLEEALWQDFGTSADAIIQQWERLDPSMSDVFDGLKTRGALFCSWSKRERRSMFAKLLASFDPLHASINAHQAPCKEKDELSPEALERWSNVEWPDPRW